MSEVAAPRLLERRDLEQLVQLCREHANFERAAWSERERAEDLGRLFLDRSDARCWVVEGAAELAGFATATLERSTWDAGHFLHMDCLFLRPAYRGQGLGRSLMAHVAALAVELGSLDVQWQTPQWNQDAARFYRRLGATSAPKLRFTLAPSDLHRLAAGDAPSAGGAEA